VVERALGNADSLRDLLDGRAVVSMLEKEPERCVEKFLSANVGVLDDPRQRG